MKISFLRLLALITLLAMLLPLATACKSDPPPNSDGDNDDIGQDENNEENNTVENYYIDAVQTGTETLTIADFSMQDIKALNSKVSQYITEQDGKAALKLDAKKESVNVSFAKSQDIYGSYYYICFSVYSEQKSDTVINVKFDGASDRHITLNFIGWKNFKVKLDFLSAKMPYPIMTGVTLSRVSGSKDTVAMLGNITATKPVYTLSVPEGVSLDDASVYSDITDTYRDFLVGSSTQDDSEAYRTKSTKAQNNAISAWNQFKATKEGLSEPEKLFGIKVFNIEQAGYGTPYKNGAQIGDFYAKINAMANGYGVAGSSLYKNFELLADIITCLDYGYKFYYGEEIVTSKTTYGNWFQWRVTIPQYLLNTITIIKDDITNEQIRKYLSPLDVLLPVPWGSGANLIWMSRCVITSAALQGDAMRICIAKEMCSEIFTYAEDYNGPETFNDGGMYRDGSFIQHTAMAYNMGYGGSLLSELSTLGYCIKDSRFNFHGAAMNNQFEWIENAYLPFMYEGLAMSTVGGRSVGGANWEKNRFNEIILSLIKMCQYAPDESKSKIEAVIRSNMDLFDTDYSTSIAYPLISYCIELKTNPAYSNSEPYTVAKVFGSMDRVVQHTPSYAVALALSSTRVYKYEAINGSNFRGWYQGDGALFIYTDGYSFEKDFYAYANPYLMPGTTVNLATRKVTAINSGFINSTPFAGGVNQENYAVAGFILGYDYASGTTSKTFANENDAKITARKSYFFFDNEIVCLGTSINDFSGKEVRTVVENRLWREEDVLSVNGSSVSQKDVETESPVRTMHFTNMGGYVFLDDTSVIYQKATNTLQDGSSNTDTRDFLEISISHGTGNGSLNGRYSYVYLPEASVSETENYDDVVILKRNQRGHAVLEKTLGIVAGVFFEHNVKDTIEVQEEYAQYTAVTNIEANTECAIMVSKGENGQYHISVSDPTQINGSLIIKVAITGITEVVSTESGVNATVSDGIATVTVNTLDARGGTFNITVK